MFNKFKQNREEKKARIKALDEKIAKAMADDNFSAKELAELLEARRKLQPDIDPNEVMKVVANVAIVVVIVGFEMSHVMNNKAARFLKVL